jgi:hypothetical protein
MCERFRFLKLLERPDWTPPQAVSLEISYEVPRDEEETSTGGIQAMAWRIISTSGPQGMYYHPGDHRAAQAALESEPGLAEELRDYCLEDYAHRK